MQDKSSGELGALYGIDMVGKDYHWHPLCSVTGYRSPPFLLLKSRAQDQFELLSMITATWIGLEYEEELDKDMWGTWR